MEKETSAEEIKGGGKIYISGFLTGSLFSLLICMLVAFGPTLYRHYIKHEPDRMAKARTIYNIMKKYYIDDIDIDEMYEGAYLGMASQPTDRYSYYISSEEADSYNEKMNGNYVGVGIVISGSSKTGKVTVENVYKPSPAYDAGIKKGDVISEVSGVAINADNMSEAVELVRGPENTTVDITVYRPDDDKTYTYTCTRANVDVNTVFWRMLDDNIGYLRITNFDSVTTGQYNAAIANLQAAGMEKLVIDLRGNPGGLLTTVSEIADTLIPEGTLTYTEDKYGKKEYVYTDDDYLGIPLAVLVNNNSASASELLSGAVKDTGVGTIVGETTFGKGVVQTTFTLEDGSMLKLTISRYYTPNGTCIDGIGVTPDIEIAADEDFEMPDLSEDDVQIDTQSDVQLKKALEVLK